VAKFDVGQATEKFRGTFNGFTRGQKTMLGLAGLAVVLGAFMLSKWTSQTQYSTLYSNLAPADASAVTQSLDAQGVKYELSNGGASILVPQDLVYRTRIDLSAKGIPSDGAPGYSLLDKQGLTTSEFRQHVDYQRALEGELAKTIRSIDGIDATSVHLVIPQEDLFSGDTTKPTASVLVRTSGLSKLSGGQVDAIVHLVASSVEGLAPEDVTVADANGNVLAAPGQNGSAATSNRMEQTTAYEDALALSLQQMVQKVTGDGHAVVRVKADLDYSKKSTMTETFADPTKRTATAEKVTKETYTAANGTTATGVLGPNGVPNTTLPGATATGAAATGAANVPAGASNYVKEDSQSDFAVGKVVEQVDVTPGTVTRLSIAVLLDKSKKLKPADAASLRKLVSAAAGLQPTRGDSLELGQLSFDASAAKLAATQLALVSNADKSRQTSDLIKSGIIGLLALLSVVLAYRGARKASTPTVTPIPLDRLPRPSTLALPVGADDDEDEDEESPIAVMAAGMAGLPPGEARPDIAALIDRQPEDVANTLRDWMADRRS
jgi:flagellar M-ring protein FliF